MGSMSGKRVYGIDLGTTYSCIAHVDEHGKPVVLQNAEGEATTPSVVFFESKDNIVVGQAAKEVVSIHTEHCVSTVKRAMGDANWEQQFFGQSYKPQDVSSFILRKLARDAEQITGEKVEDVVITCPAYFGVNEKEATKQAGILAGLNVLYVIPEPTAAALAYGIEQTDEQVIMVYDLGGGTFDITLIEIKASEINVICTGGDHQLGGKDWDDAIVDYFTHKFAEATGKPADALLDDQETYQELLNAAERCKKMLSSRQSVTEAVRYGADRVKVELTRETFDDITAQYLERTLSLTDQELEKARQKGYARIDKLLLVGGSTYMPQVIETVKAKYPFEVRQFDPNQAVAKGAAIFGYKCYLDEQIKIRVADKMGKAAGEVDIEKVADAVVERAQKEVALEHGLALPGLKAIVNKKITNVTSKSFGIVVMNQQAREVVTNLIEIDDPVPKAITKRFGTFDEGQIQVDLRCMENKQRGKAEVSIAECTLLGEAVLSFGRALAKSAPIEITFNLGPDGLLTVKGRDLTTGREIDADFKTESIMTHEEEEAAKSRNLSLQVA
jgi:molecular chaperone DnaK (HSP70)